MFILLRPLKLLKWFKAPIKVAGKVVISPIRLPLKILHLNCFNLLVRATRKVHRPKFRALAFRFRVKETNYRAIEGHTHPVAAKCRNDVVHSVREFLSDAGYTMYDPSPAKAARDRKYDIAGHRHVHSVKDLGSDLACRTLIPKDSVITLIDQDFHLPTLNIFGGKPIVIFTLAVDSLSGKGCDSTWYFVDRNLVVEHVNGGAVYMQSLYNYSSDQVVIPHSSKGIIPCFTVYDVHLHHVQATNKMVVFLCPSTTHYMPLRMFQFLGRLATGHNIDVQLLTRMDSVQYHAHFLVMKTVMNGTVGYCIKRNMDQAHDSTVFVPEGVYRALAWASKGVKMLTVAEVERLSRSYGSPITGIALATVIEFLSIPFETNCGLNVYIPPVTSQGDFEHDIGKPRGEVALEPIVESDALGVVLSENEPAQRSYVMERMVPNINNETFDDKMKSYAEEYIKLLVKSPGRCVPATVRDVIEDQNGRLQRARNARESMFEPGPSSTKVALKSEVALKGGPARGVSTMTTSHSIDSGAVSRGFKPALRKNNHYMVGKTPEAIAEAVCLVAKTCQEMGVNVGETDYSKLDETISKDMREFVFNPSVRRAFARSHHEYINRVLSEDTELSGRVGKIKIKTGSKNNSGSGLTTDINTVVAPLVPYVAHRESGDIPSVAFSKLGVAFGDDGLSVGRREEDDFGALCIKVAGWIGLKLKYISHPSDGPLYFLGRLYVHPTTTAVSMALPSKVLRKIPICIGKAELHRADRIRGYYVTEQHVPVVSDYLRACARAYKVDLGIKAADMEAIKGRDRDLYYKLSHGPYPYHESDAPILLDAVCKDLQLTQAEAKELMTKLKTVTTVKDLEGIKIPLPPIEGLSGVNRY